MLGIVNYYFSSSGLNQPSHPHSNRNAVDSDRKATDDFINKTIEADEDMFASSVFIVFQIFLVVVCVVSLISIAFMAYVIFNNKHLRTVPNILIMNSLLADAYSLILTPIDFVIYPIVEFKSPTFMALLYFYDVQYVLKNVQAIFMFLLTIDWCLASYFQEASTSYRNHYAYSIAITWCLGFITILFSFTYKMFDKFFIVPLLSLGLLYLCLFAFVLILQIVRLVKKCKKTASAHPTLSLSISTVYLFCLSAYLVEAIIIEFSGGWIYGQFFYYLELLTSTFIFIILYRHNYDFQSSFRQIIRRSRSKTPNEAVRLQDVETNSED